MKTLIALFMAGVSCLSMAVEQTADAEEQPPVEQYSYSTHLDIAKVVSYSEVPNVCSVVPVQMTYDDHQGARHTIEYLVMGNGCNRN
ncbi:DUF2790 domain-containing protein [Azotobacter bryophylli]|uniref:DUF2790 domain-containing protein n=1 Tax=Azotobacter bryophylli TaxID=1986537 RepID=A0ABV7AP29_9GAMM